MTGQVIWFEVLGQDADKLQAFYCKLFGWKLEGGPGWEEYGMLEAPEEGAGISGAVGKAPDASSWTTFFVHVEDVATALAKATRLGAKLLTPPTAIPDGSTIARVEDPEGHVLGLWQSPS